MGLASMGSSMPVLTRVSRTLVTQPAVPVGSRGAPFPVGVLKLHPGEQNYRHFPVFRQSATEAVPLPSVTSMGAGVQASAPWQPSRLKPHGCGAEARSLNVRGVELARPAPPGFQRWVARGTTCSSHTPPSRPGPLWGASRSPRIRTEAGPPSTLSVHCRVSRTSPSGT